MNEKILIVDDEPRIVRLVSQVLRAVGYHVISTTRGELVLEMAAVEQPDLILLDIMFDGRPEGYEICRRLREFSDLPVIMLTAKAQDADLLVGFDVGADDYLTKPFNSKELVARVKAVLRRTQRPEETSTATCKFGDLEINFARHAVRARGQQVALTRTEFALLRELALNANRVMLHQDLLTKVWGPEYRDELDYLRAYIRYLRRKLEVDPAKPRYLVNVSGVGYMLVGPENDQLNAD
jgi:two-component system KDP operon response regulator KdpE